MLKYFISLRWYEIAPETGTNIVPKFPTPEISCLISLWIFKKCIKLNPNVFTFDYLLNAI